MPVGELLIEKVAGLLSVHLPKTIREIAVDIAPPVTDRAVRFAVGALLGAGRAKLLGPKKSRIKGNRQHYKVLAIPHEPSTSPD